eukprot:3973674-Lingulodinium_polyedra.AAC.1
MRGAAGSGAVRPAPSGEARGHAWGRQGGRGGRFRAPKPRVEAGPRGHRHHWACDDGCPRGQGRHRARRV